jgi:hypothetical protein
MNSQFWTTLRFAHLPSILTIVLLTCFTTGGLSAQQLPKPVDWHAFQFLLGEWIGEGGGDPGQGAGGFTFSPDLQNTILVRKSYADYPAANGHPAFSHNDLMVLYQEGGETRAIYFDNEQHVIQYSVSITKDSNSVIFVSDISNSAPRYRLTNTKSGPGAMKITFEIAPPGKPEAFSRYIEAKARRKK